MNNKLKLVLKTLFLISWFLGTIFYIGWYINDPNIQQTYRNIHPHWLGDPRELSLDAIGYILIIGVWTFIIIPSFTLNDTKRTDTKNLK